MAQMLWVAGKLYFDGTSWEVMGVFDSESAAAALCTGPEHFVAPIELNVPAPAERTDWPGGYLPFAKK